MDKFDSIQVCTSYKLGENELEYMPYEILDDELKPVLETHQGWNTDITKINKIENLPQNFLNYIKYVEKAVECPVTVVSVGPDRKQTIIR
jgi:adenylosuccinate synthase